MGKVSFNDFENHIFILNLFFLSSSIFYLKPHKRIKKFIINKDVECNFKMWKHFYLKKIIYSPRY